jgi:hypothetical protein
MSFSLRFIAAVFIAAPYGNLAFGPPGGGFNQAPLPPDDSSAKPAWAN